MGKTMDRAALLKKIWWHVQQPWHFRQQPDPTALSVTATVKGLQTFLLAADGAVLRRTLAAVWQRPVALEELERLEITWYQEGAEQRVWRAQATLAEGGERCFGIIVARATGASSNVTQHDFVNLQRLQARQARYCAMPYVSGCLPGNVAAYTVEWLDDYKEVVFEITLAGGVFLVNAHGAHRHFSPQTSRHIWRGIVDILWHYPGLQAVKVQAGDFVARVVDGAAEIDLKLTTARALGADPGPEAQIHAILTSMITASGYLSDGRQPFDRHMPQEVFISRMHAVLRRRFADHALGMAQRQWELFAQGAFARQEDWLKEDCILATYNHLCRKQTAASAWRQTCQRWQAYADAVQAHTLPPSWWFPAAEVPAVLARLAPPHLLR
jgi:hypothetical protein